MGNQVFNFNRADWWDLEFTPNDLHWFLDLDRVDGEVCERRESEEHK